MRVIGLASQASIQHGPRVASKKDNSARLHLSSRVTRLFGRGTVLEQSQLLSEAHFAMEHVNCLKGLTRHRPSGRSFQRRVRALEEAALRMELEAKALSVRHWRA